MSLTRLQPPPPKPDVSDNDRIMAALNQALIDQKKDEELGQSAKGIAIVWYREYPDGTFGDSHIIQGLNALEAIGLLNLTAHDIAADGLNGPDHFPPEPEDKPA